MLGAVISLFVVLAAAYALTQVGGVITLLFVAAILYLAYRRLSLLTFTLTFTVLLGAYTMFGAPLNSSPSHHTVPASSASFSVCDMRGNSFR